MRLLSLTIRNYRIHHDITVEFDPSRNLIGGPNETGKSTLAEAIHRVLFMRFKSGGDLRKSMVSTTHGGQPEVKLTFESAGDTWTIEKHFAGSAKGTARLSSRSGTSLQGDAAEEKLAELTANPDGAANRENDLSTRWAHLWVWQGAAGSDPSSHAADRRDELIQRLQENGLAAVMQSETDEKTREKIRAAHETLFTKTGAIKAGSRLEIANRTLLESTTKLTAATEQKARLESAIIEQEIATKALAESTAALPAARDALTAAKAAMTRATELRSQLENQTLIQTQAAATRQQLAKADRQIRELLTQAEATRETLAPSEEKLKILAARTAAASQKATAAKAGADSITTALRTARQHHDLATACVTRFEKAAAHEALTTKARDIASIEKSLTADRDSLSRLPAISAKQLDSLRTLESQHARSQSALEAIATGIELIASRQTVSLGAQSLEPGKAQIITETSELSLADGTRLRIQPGGGTSLADSRRKVDDLEEQIAALLDQLTIADSKHAAEILTRRQALEQKITATQAQLKTLGAADLPEALASAKQALNTATAEVERRSTALPNGQTPTLPENLQTAQAWQTQTRETLLAEEQREQTLRVEADAAHQAHQQKLTAHQTAQQALETQRRQLADLETSVRTLEQNHGDTTARTQALAAAAAEETSAKATLAATTAALAELNPERLQQEVTRLERVITNEQTKQTDANTRIAVACNTLASDGTSDPEADLLRAKARHAAAHAEHAREKRHADSIALLHRLFSESQATISESVTQPIADRVASYLERIYGRGVRIGVDWNDASKATLRITRPGTPTFAFDALSGGAKEQVAAAVRLATAEILAASHHGCLPILFDDSFAFSDEDRIQSLQSMLDLAAARGLQVIVLTCTPAQYIGFGARETRLSPPARTSGPEPVTAP